MNERTIDQALAHAEKSRSLHPDQGCAHPEYVHADLVLLADEVKRLRQGLWEVAGICGVDQDGDKTPDAMTFPDIVVYAKRAVQELRDDRDEAIRPLFSPR